MSIGSDDLLRYLRAAAEPTRLRILAVLTVGEFNVTDLTRILGQSQPRVSRHLKLLCESGLLDRFREQHWINYRVPVDGPGAHFVRSMLDGVDQQDSATTRDRERAREILEERKGAPSAGGGDVADVIDAELHEQGFESVLYLGAAPAEALFALGPRSRRATGVSASLAEVRRARAALHARGLSHCVLQQGDFGSVGLPAAAFDLVIVDRVVDTHSHPQQVLLEAARVVRKSGSVLIVSDYEVLDERDPSGNPLSRLREWIERAGMVCSRLRPVDVAGRHLLVAAARTDSSVAAAA
jgi:ArsR family transcriptional regulator